MAISTREEIVTRIKANCPALVRYGIKALVLFGSAARDRMWKGSDVDILVQFDKATWANYIGLKFYLEELLGREVDLATPKALKFATRPSLDRKRPALCRLAAQNSTFRIFCKPVKMF